MPALGPMVFVTLAKYLPCSRPGALEVESFVSEWGEARPRVSECSPPQHIFSQPRKAAKGAGVSFGPSASPSVAYREGPLCLPGGQGEGALGPRGLRELSFSWFS